MSSGHQITIPIGPFTAAELTPGDRFLVTARAPGEVLFERVHAAETESDPQQQLDVA